MKLPETRLGFTLQSFNLHSSLYSYLRPTWFVTCLPYSVLKRISPSFVENQPMHRSRNFLQIFLSPYFVKIIQHLHLTAHNWQNWKSVFLLCYFHEIYTVEAIDQENYNILEKLRFLWICKLLGNFLKSRYFANSFLV